MALLINKKVTTNFGIELDSIYVRFTYKVNDNSNKIILATQSYVNKETFTENPSRVLKVINLINFMGCDYNRERDGLDILSFLHDQLVYNLIHGLHEDQKTIDPSTGEEITIKKEIRAPFCDKSEINIVDLDDETENEELE